MLCAWLLKPHADQQEGRFAQACERAFERLHNGYRRSLDWVLDHQRITLAVAIATMAATAVLYVGIPKGFFPQQDNGLIQGVAEAAPGYLADRDACTGQPRRRIIGQDPAVARVYFWIGPNPTVSQGKVMINLKPFSERTASAGEVIRRLQPALDRLSGIKVFMQANQDIQIGGRASKTQYQYTLQDPDSVEAGPLERRAAGQAQNACRNCST